MSLNVHRGYLLGESQSQWCRGTARPTRPVRTTGSTQRSPCLRKSALSLSPFGILRHSQPPYEPDRRYIPRPPRPRPSPRPTWILSPTSGRWASPRTSRPGTRSHRSRPSHPLPEAPRTRSDALPIPFFHPRVHVLGSVVATPRRDLRRVQSAARDSHSSQLADPSPHSWPAGRSPRVGRRPDDV